ncbi:unnamed protein product [Rodentolepis nana]|uniref:Group XV phospholipase A2 n=1 Tax=Rodentolepis nana TaxID=102285 RepID=A0A0R3TLN4_RODNA|nr:unnamed protein product [Rodentolepis nana]
MAYSIEGRVFTLGSLFLLATFCITSSSFVISIDRLRSLVKSDMPHPIILIPGDGGSQAYAQFRDHQSDPFPIWVDLRYLVSPRTFSDYFKLIYNNKTRKTEDNEKAIITFPGWGETWPVDNLDSRPHSVTKYFEDVTADFIQNPYYVKNFTIRGAPFDFRKAPNENVDFVPKMKALVEETFINGQNQKVVLLAHSMGSLYCLHFLNRQTDAWKRKYIKAFISASAPLGGSIKALKIEASGDNFGIYLDSPLWYREVQRSMPSLAFLLPNPQLWSPSEVVISTPTKNYTVHDYKEFFSDIGFPEGYQMFQDTKATVNPFVPPSGLDEIYCIYSSAVQTPGSMVYDSTFPDAQPTINYEPDGDGTVNARSLAVCQSWSGGVKVKTLVIPGVNHLSIVLDPRFIKAVKEIANADKLLPMKGSLWRSLLRSVGWTFWPSLSPSNT